MASKSLLRLAQAFVDNVVLEERYSISLELVNIEQTLPSWDRKNFVPFMHIVATYLQKKKFNIHSKRGRELQDVIRNRLKYPEKYGYAPRDVEGLSQVFPV